MSGPRRCYGVLTERWGWQPLASEQNGLPTWRYGRAPAGLVTRRQMRELGLAPGGADPVGQLMFRHKGREVRALLWDRGELTAKRVPTPAQRAALGKALKARCWCPACQRHVGYCVPTSLGMCVDCAFPDLVTTPAPGATAASPAPASSTAEEVAPDAAA